MAGSKMTRVIHAVVMSAVLSVLSIGCTSRVQVPYATTEIRAHTEPQDSLNGDIFYLYTRELATDTSYGPAVIWKKRKGVDVGVDLTDDLQKLSDVIAEEVRLSAVRGRVAIEEIIGTIILRINARRGSVLTGDIRVAYTSRQLSREQREFVDKVLLDYEIKVEQNIWRCRIPMVQFDGAAVMRIYSGTVAPLRVNSYQNTLITPRGSLPPVAAENY